MQVPQRRHPHTSRRIVRATRACICLALIAVALIVWGGAPSLRAAGPAALVKDINPTSHHLTQGPAGLVAIGSRIFFSNYDANNGRELWVSDGTAAGTRLVRDIVPGWVGSGPGNLKNVNGTLFFTANASERHDDYELWKSDGTAAGTVLVKDIHPGRISSYPAQMTVVGGMLFFTAEDSLRGRRLWKSDGTAAGTVLVKAINPAGGERPENLVNVNGKLFFTADDGTHGRELWISDGSREGTRMVKDIHPNRGSFQDSIPGDFTVVGDKLFFITTEEPLRGQLWQSDGTEGGTTRVLPANPDADLTAGELENVNGTLYFHGTSRIDETGHRSTGLWKSNGTAAGTVEVKSFSTGTGGSSLPAHLKGVGNLVFFAGSPADDLSSILWVSNGTEAGTQPVGNIRIGENFLWSSIDLDGTLYFAGNDGGDIELWKSNGTDAGTTRVKDINASGSSEPFSLVHIGHTLYFAANAGQGPALWKSDGTDGGTIPVKDTSVAARGAFDELFYYNPPPNSHTLAVGDRLFFAADDGARGAELWASDGTMSGTRLVKDINPAGGSSPRNLTARNDTLFFIADGATSVGLWKSNGTNAGTVPVKLFDQPNPFVRPLYDLTLSGGTLYFFTNTSGGQVLWKSDGSTSGTLPVSTIPGDPPIHLTTVNGRLFFVASDAEHGAELWTSDGTAAGTHMLKEIRATADSSHPFGLIDVGGTLFFLVRPGVGDGYELWKSDGTAAGTVRVKPLNTDGPQPDNLTAVGSRLFFTAFDEIAGVELWVSDGTPAGTRRVKDINTVPNLPPPFSANQGSYPSSLASVGSKLLFTADDGVHGRELWRSDGTAAGTVLVKDLNPGLIDSAAGAIQQVRADGWALFAASDGFSGVELWQTDGTPGRTRRLQDIAPGPSSSNPAAFVATSSKVYFAADDGATGTELWSLDRDVFPDLLRLKGYLPLARR